MKLAEGRVPVARTAVEHTQIDPGALTVVTGETGTPICPPILEIVSIQIRNERRRQGSHSAVDVVILQIALAKTLRRYGSHRALLLALPGAFVIAKEEKPVLFDRTSQGCAEDVSEQLVWDIRLAASRFRSFDEVIVGAGDGVAVVFVDGTVEIVGPALGDQRYLGSRAG